MAIPLARYPDLEGAAVLITGGAEGIGRAMAEAFLAQGSRVGILDIDRDAIQRFQSDTPALVAEQVGLRDIPATRSAIARIAGRIGEPRILINNAAHDQRHGFETLGVAEWDERFAVNLRHIMFCAQAVAPAMRRAGRGVILNMGSTAWMKASINMIAYATAKSAVEGLTRSLSRELGVDGIRVNSIAPGWVMTRRQIECHATPEKRAANLDAQSLKREIQPEDIAAAALFLCSDGASAITGQTLIVDGGTCYG
jgi:NAD(P)-dependent dehydrogenase (short-subunit alcohol dehydrogenase family)